MSALLDELKSVLTSFRDHVAGLVNSGTLVTVDRHLDTLSAAASAGAVEADSAVKNVLTELYGALHGAPAPTEPAEAPPTVVEPVAPVASVETAVAAPAATVEAAPAPAVEETAVPAAEPQTPEAAV